MMRRANPATTDSGHPIESTLRADFRCSGYLALHRIMIRFEDGVVLLAGSVPTYYLKQVAIAMVRRRFDRVPISDRIDVSPRNVAPESL